MPDFISTRYNKSRSIAAIVTVMALLGIVPYISLQLKAVFSTFEIITSSGASAAGAEGIFNYRLLIVLMLILFTIIFGVRRVAPTERHQGIVVALAFESIIKLTAFLLVGIFVVYYLFGGLDDLFSRVIQNDALRTIQKGENAPSYMSWMSFMMISMSAIIFLPRQFHIGVIENFDEKHVRTAMWVFPLYMMLITFFVFPIGIGGVLLGYPAQGADTFVLKLPMDAGYSWLSLFVFLGGFSASMGMIVVESMTMSTMFTNHILIQAIDWFRGLRFLKRYLLQLRWFSVALLIFIGFWFESAVAESQMLDKMGMIAFSAVFQFAPAMLGGMFWKKGNLAGARMGLTAGFIVWFYTLIIPALVSAGIITSSIMNEGLFGVAQLKPGALFGIEGLDQLSNCVFWSFILNTGFYIFGSLVFSQSPEEEKNCRQVCEYSRREKNKNDPK